MFPLELMFSKEVTDQDSVSFSNEENKGSCLLRIAACLNKCYKCLWRAQITLQQRAKCQVIMRGQGIMEIEIEAVEVNTLTINTRSEWSRWQLGLEMPQAWATLESSWHFNSRQCWRWREQETVCES